MDAQNSLQANECYKNFSKHGNCSKCNIAITQHKYRKGRTVCKLCYNNYVFAYYKIKFCSNSSPKSDVGTHTNFSDKQEGLNKKVGSSKKDCSNIQDRSNKQDKRSKHERSNKQS